MTAVTRVCFWRKTASRMSLWRIRPWPCRCDMTSSNAAIARAICPHSPLLRIFRPPARRLTKLVRRSMIGDSVPFEEGPHASFTDNEPWRHALAGAGQSARFVRSRRRSAAGGHRSHLGLRSRAGVGDSGQRQGPDADFAVLVRPVEGCGSQPPDFGRRKRISRRIAGLRAISCKADRCW